MSKPTAKVTNRWHAKNYDILNATIPKGYIAKMREVSTAEGKSVNAYMVEKIGEILDADEKEDAE